MIFVNNCVSDGCSDSEDAQSVRIVESIGSEERCDPECECVLACDEDDEDLVKIIMMMMMMR